MILPISTVRRPWWDLINMNLGFYTKHRFITVVFCHFVKFHKQSQLPTWVLLFLLLRLLRLLLAFVWASPAIAIHDIAWPPPRGHDNKCNGLHYRLTFTVKIKKQDFLSINWPLSLKSIVTINSIDVNKYHNYLPSFTKYKQVCLVSNCLLKGIKKIICLIKLQNKKMDKWL